MGGFVLLHALPGEDRSAMHEAALQAFARMGIAGPRTVRGDAFILTLFPKRQASKPTFKEFPNGDFACVCGTLIYDSMIGEPAIAAFHRDYDGSGEPPAGA